MAFVYFISGARIESSVPLPTIGEPQAPGSSSTIRFRIASVLPVSCFGAALELLVGSKEEPILSIARLAEGYWLKIHDHADFWVRKDGSEIVCAPPPGAPQESIEQLLVDHVLPLILQLAGQPSLHASAVRLAGEVVAFVGPSGSGKSTLAASLCGPGQLVCDDCLALSPGPNGITVHASYPSIRLWDDSADAVAADRMRVLASPASSKLRVSERSAAGTLRLARIYLLERGEGPPSVEHVRRRDALLALTLHVHRLDPEPQRLLVRELDWLADVVRAVPVARLRYAHKYDHVSAVHAAIWRDLTNPSAQAFSVSPSAPQ